MVINITADEVKLIQEENKRTLIIDVRTPAEFLNGTINGAINMDLSDPQFLNKIKDLNPTGTYMLLCQSGNRSGIAAGYLDKMGFKNVCNIIGGMIAWDGKVAFPKAA